MSLYAAADRVAGEPPLHRSVAAGTARSRQQSARAPQNAPRRNHLEYKLSVSGYCTRPDWQTSGQQGWRAASADCTQWVRGAQLGAATFRQIISSVVVQFSASRGLVDRYLSRQRLDKGTGTLSVMNKQAYARTLPCHIHQSMHPSTVTRSAASAPVAQWAFLAHVGREQGKGTPRYSTVKCGALLPRVVPDRPGVGSLGEHTGRAPVIANGLLYKQNRGSRNPEPIRSTRSSTLAPLHPATPHPLPEGPLPRPPCSATPRLGPRLRSHAGAFHGAKAAGLTCPSCVRGNP